MQCQNCGRDFKRNREWQRFCDKQCQQAWNRLQYRKAEVMAAEVKANGHLISDDAHQAKWAEIRAEWAKEDRQEAQPVRFLRRF